MPYAINKYADQSAYLCSLISAFVIRFLNTKKPRHEKTSSGCATRVDSNQPAQPRLEILRIETRGIILSRQRITKALIRLRGCAG